MGPYTIMDKLGSNIYRLQIIDSNVMESPRHRPETDQGERNFSRKSIDRSFRRFFKEY